MSSSEAEGGVVYSEEEEEAHECTDACALYVPQLGEKALSMWDSPEKWVEWPGSNKWSQLRRLFKSLNQQRKFLEKHRCKVNKPASYVERTIIADHLAGAINAFVSSSIFRGEELPPIKQVAAKRQVSERRQRRASEERKRSVSSSSKSPSPRSSPQKRRGPPSRKSPANKRAKIESRDHVTV